jgi:mono/diheme cytochrome c family protein
VPRVCARAFLAAVVAARIASAGPPPDDVALYQRWCTRCHGERGDGRGPAAGALALNARPPRDFTAGAFHFTSTPPGYAPTEADLVRTIAKGIPGTSMPWFEDLLAPDEMRRLAAVVQSFATTPRPAADPIDLGPPPADDAASRARGALLYLALGCPACHDEPARREVRAADLTRPWTFRGGAEARDVALRVAAGIAGTAMPAYPDAVPAGELWDVAHYVLSLARAPSLEAAAVERARRPPGLGEPRLARGEYVVKAGTCFLCHVQMKDDGAYVEGSFGAGGMRVEILHTATVFTRNLTPHATGLADWTADDVRAALRDGRSRDGRRLNPLDMPWTILAQLTDEDVDAIHAYLQSLPPRANAVPAPARPGVWDGLAGKARLLASGAHVVAGFHPGNGGTPSEAAPPAPPAHDELVVAGGALALLVVHAALRRGRRRLERLAVLALAIAVPLVYAWPPLGWMPAALVKAEAPFATLGRLIGMPPIRRPPAPVAIADPDVAALAARGRYIAALGTCPLCHTAGPSVTRPLAPFPEMGGGMRVNWRVFGTTYSRNLTPHPTTGLGGWSRAEIRRAIVSGIAKDGRQMHWQAMPWDHFSNLEPEDLEALVVYLQHLPPVDSHVPAPVPPAPGDAPADTFSFGYTGVWRR